MRQLNLFLPIVILTVSFAAAFADTGDLTVISGKEFKIHYETQDAQVLSVQPNTNDLGLIFSIQANTPVSTIELTLPRELIDSTEINGKDIDYIVLLDGTFASYISKEATSTSRTILIQLAPENKELEIIGTHLATGSSTQVNNNGGQPTSTVTPSLGSQEQKPEETRHATGQNTFNATQQPPQTTENTVKTQKQPLEKIISLLQLYGNSPLHLTKKQLVEYSVIGAIVLIITLVIASSTKYKTRQQIHK